MRPNASPQGNARESLAPALPAAENIAPRPDLPPVPEHLKDFGTKIWFEVWRSGGKAYNPLTDAYVVERYASLQERRHELMAVLDAEGFLTVGSQGQTVAHPAARLLQDVEQKLLPLEDRLGLSPESRVRLGIGIIEHKTKFDLFMDETGDQHGD